MNSNRNIIFFKDAQIRLPHAVAQSCSGIISSQFANDLYFFIFDHLFKTGNVNAEIARIVYCQAVKKQMKRIVAPTLDGDPLITAFTIPALRKAS